MLPAFIDERRDSAAVEVPEKLDALCEDLRAEQQPASRTEEMLVDGIAQHYWRIRRFRYLESQMWVSQGRNEQGELCANLDQAVWMIDHGLAADVQRALNSAERSFHKTLKTLQETKKLRDEAAVLSKPKTQSGFVPQNQSAAARAVGAAQDEAAVLSELKTPFRFVPQNPESAGPTSQNSSRKLRRTLVCSPISSISSKRQARTSSDLQDLAERLVIGTRRVDIK